MNVKPGDFAKVIPPHFRAGTLVSVKAPCTPEDFAMLCTTDATWAAAEQVWLCSLLVGATGIDMTGARRYFFPGDEAWFEDKYLRRIDPEADDTTEDTAERLPAPREAATA